MKRGPDETLERDALLRRERFPVAVVVVVHDDISLMRATLEEVATVAEFIVSANNISRVGDAPSGFFFLDEHEDQITTRPYIVGGSPLAEVFEADALALPVKFRAYVVPGVMC